MEVFDKDTDIIRRLELIKVNNLDPLKYENLKPMEYENLKPMDYENPPVDHKSGLEDIYLRLNDIPYRSLTIGQIQKRVDLDSNSN